MNKGLIILILALTIGPSSFLTKEPVPPGIIVIAKSFGSKEPVSNVQVLCNTNLGEKSQFELFYTGEDGKVRISPLAQYGTYTIRVSRKGCPTPRYNEKTVTLSVGNPIDTVNFTFGCKGPSPELGRTYGIFEKADEFHREGVQENDVLELIKTERIDLTYEEALKMFDNISFLYRKFEIESANQLIIPLWMKEKPENLEMTDELYLDKVRYAVSEALIQLASTPRIRELKSTELFFLFEKYRLDFLKKELP